MKSGARIYNLFPSLIGPIERWSAQLPRIAAMRFDWVYVNPFHETGYSGSLYAVKDYYRLNPLFRGSAQRSDDEIVRRFVEDAATAGLGVMMDLVVNHTARDAELTRTHPQWYRRGSDGEIASPSANDPADPQKTTVWTDLAEIDYAERPARAEIVAYFAAVVRHYAGLGVRGFRCDAAYKLPGDVWAPIIAAARETAAGVVFAAENLGAPFEAVTQLRPAGFDYLFNSSKWWDFRSSWLLEQYEEFRRIAPSIAFPESHDTPRLIAELAGRGPAEVEAEYRFRYLFAAFFSSGLMMPVGYEFGFARPLDVVLTRPEHWEEPRFDISAFVAEVNAMKAAIPALNEEGPERSLARGGATIALVRDAQDGGGAAIALLNADASHGTTIDAPALLHGVDGGAGLVDVTPGAAPASPAQPLALEPLEMRVFATQRNGAVPPDDAGFAAEARPCVIENVWPELDAGRHPVKRIAGDRFTVSADIVREGHDALAAVLCYRKRGAHGWHETPMRLLDNDRWTGSFLLESIGRYQYALEAWPDAFASWRHDVEKKREAGQAVGLELVEGRALVTAAAGRSAPADLAALEALLAELDRAADDDDAAEMLLSPAVADAMERAPDRSRATRYPRELEVVVDRRAAQVGAWYEFFPRSQSPTPGKPGTFADAARRLPELRALGFDVVYLPPIHPIGVAFRKGRNNGLDPAPGDPGSPWAIGNAAGGHRSVDPALGTLDDFDRFVATARAHDLEVALDYALQCSPDHPYVREHPEWFVFRPDGTIKYAENPPKKYQDIVNFNWYGPHAPALWRELRDVVEFWIGHGVRIFRVDNPHTKPFAFWEWMIGDVQGRHPEIVFLAEAFTRPKVMRQLAKLGFTQSYTYFTWRNFKGELTDYVEELASSEMAQYFRPNFFANTPDILPPFLQTGGRPAFRIRLFLAATLSSLYGIYSGFELCENAALPEREEYADSEKYEIKFRDWDAPGNIKDDVARINRIRREHAALQDWRNVRFLRADDDNVLFYAKTGGGETLLIAVNLDPFHPVDVRLHLPLAELGIAPGESFACEDLLGGDRYMWNGPAVTVRLDPEVNPAAIFRVDGRMRVDYENPSY